MGTVHDLLEARGKQGALEAGLDRSVVEAAALYMGDEDGSLNFVYSGWAQCALPHRRLADDRPWEIAVERIQACGGARTSPQRRGRSARVSWRSLRFPCTADPSLSADRGPSNRIEGGRTRAVSS